MEGEKIIFTIYNNKKDGSVTFEKREEKIVTNDASGTAKVEWKKESFESDSGSRNNLLLYFTAHIDGFPEVKSSITDISNDCDCQSFFV